MQQLLPASDLLPQLCTISTDQGPGTQTAVKIYSIYYIVKECLERYIYIYIGESPFVLYPVSELSMKVYGNTGYTLKALFAYTMYNSVAAHAYSVFVQQRQQSLTRAALL